jgi:hypothetical protein
MDEVERKLGEIVKNTGSKSSFLLTFTGKGSRIEKTFEPEISITPGCHYEIAFTSLETYFSIPNIDTGNNVLTIGKTDEKVLKTIKIEPGCYGLLELNREITRLLKGNMDNAVSFEPNYSTFKCIMVLKAGYKVDFTKDGSLRPILGFNKKVYKADEKTAKRIESEHIVDIMKVNSIFIHCDLVSGSYVNGVSSPILYSFFPVADPGDKIVEKPAEYIYLPIESDVIRRMTVWLTDQELNPINLREETLTIGLHLKSC